MNQNFQNYHSNHYLHIQNDHIHIGKIYTDFYLNYLLYENY